jgi:hypothetical protein
MLYFETKEIPDLPYPLLWRNELNFYILSLTCHTVQLSFCDIWNSSQQDKLYPLLTIITILQKCNTKKSYLFKWCQEKKIGKDTLAWLWPSKCQENSLHIISIIFSASEYSQDIKLWSRASSITHLNHLVIHLLRAVEDINCDTKGTTQIFGGLCLSCTCWACWTPTHHQMQRLQVEVYLSNHFQMNQNLFPYFIII